MKTLINGIRSTKALGTSTVSVNRFGLQHILQFVNRNPDEHEYTKKSTHFANLAKRLFGTSRHITFSMSLVPMQNRKTTFRPVLAHGFWSRKTLKITIINLHFFVRTTNWYSDRYRQNLSFSNLNSIDKRNFPAKNLLKKTLSSAGVKVLHAKISIFATSAKDFQNLIGYL